jgi:uncharacterized protein (TIGR00730 family)
MINNELQNKGLEELKNGCVPIQGEEEVLCEIQKEFRDGIENIIKFPKSVTFYGSAIIKNDHPSYEKARNLAYRISKELDYTIFSGGGGGIMEAANRGGFEGNGKSVGVTIELPNEQKTNQYVTDEIKFKYFFARKTTLSYSTEVCIFCPGAYGTLDELFEIITLQHTNKIGHFPVILFGVDFWSPLIKFLKETMIDKYQTLKEKDLELFKITDSEDEVLEIIKSSSSRYGQDVLK